MDTFTLRIDGGTQPRERLDEATVERYAEAMTSGLWDFGRSSDPAVAFYDGTEYWLSDGFHRLEAAKRAGKLDEFSACLEVRQGTLRDAILYSVGANAHHGFPRSNEDKRRVVSRLLDDPEWSKWSDREIARRCYVNHHLVSRLRSVTGSVPSERTYTTKHGTTATMDTSAIGGKSKAPALPATSAVQLEVGSTETERDGVGYFTGLGHQAADDDKPAAKPVEQEYDSGTQALLKRYLSQNDFASVVRHPARRVAAAARTFTPKTVVKVRQRMERQRQWLSDFLAALDEAAER